MSRKRQYRDGDLARHLVSLLATFGLTGLAAQVHFLAWWAPPVLFAFCIGAGVRYMSDMDQVHEKITDAGVVEFWLPISAAVLLIAAAVACIWATSYALVQHTHLLVVLPGILTPAALFIGIRTSFAHKKALTAG